MRHSILILGLLLAPVSAAAQQASHQMDHAAHALQGTDGPAPTEPGQAAFAAIAEIVAILTADPHTDWSRVDIDALRAHLVDMDRVTMAADVTTQPVPGGAGFTVTATDEATRASIRRMVLAHAATMSGTDGWTYAAEPTESGARLTVTGPAADTARIRGLGFFGILASGGHHQAHHLALARGAAPHAP